jgi:hypothetical protein
MMPTLPSGSAAFSEDSVPLDTVIGEIAAYYIQHLAPEAAAVAVGFAKQIHLWYMYGEV